MKPIAIIKSLTVAVVALGLAVAATSSSPNALASGGPGGGGGGGGATIANVLRGPWESLVINTVLIVTFNNNGTFTATIQPQGGGILSDAGTWTLQAPVAPQPFANPQGHLVLIDTNGTVLLSGDVLLFNPDQMFMNSATENVTVPGITTELVLTKFAP